MDDKLIIIFVTCPPDKADIIAETLVSDKLAACVNIMPVKSVYTWQGKLNKDSESLLIIKSKQSVYNKLESRLMEIHPYDVPEIIALESTKVEKAYFQWVCDSVK